ncbi:hypothetical protein EPD60_03895 [Flaviaesturariibacter flavus]|uniref:Uncharacterized protein n=1 Tax=Flaviaesturariibacter flavus TaxID=2502780 RepID=A0A4R1BME3_9BACT|nr:hypothetical protein [Flaviaesturariibacter flavus]TCJ18651.1 hypothetical protein EPD60_03895 [Flaviaesturariibacter flavus]
MNRYLLAGALLTAMLASCSDENEDLTHEVNHNGSVESSIQVSNLDAGHRLLTTRHKVWVGGSVYRTIEYTDTLPSLGLEHTVAENEEGDEKNVTVDKDYEIYITVK